MIFWNISIWIILLFCLFCLSSSLFSSLPISSLPFPSLPFPSNPFPSNPFPSLYLPSLPFCSVLFCHVHFCSVLFSQFCSVLFFLFSSLLFSCSFSFTKPFLNESKYLFIKNFVNPRKIVDSVDLLIEVSQLTKTISHTHPLTQALFLREHVNKLIITKPDLKRW